MTHQDIVIIQDFKDFQILHYAPFLPQDSEFIPLFEHQLIKMEQSGLTYRLKKKYGLLDLDSGEGATANTTTSLGYDNLGFLFIIMGVGIVLSGLIVFAEACANVLRKTKRKK